MCREARRPRSRAPHAAGRATHCVSPRRRMNFIPGRLRWPGNPQCALQREYATSKANFLDSACGSCHVARPAIWNCIITRIFSARPWRARACGAHSAPGRCVARFACITCSVHRAAVTAAPPQLLGRLFPDALESRREVELAREGRSVLRPATRHPRADRALHPPDLRAWPRSALCAMSRCGRRRRRQSTPSLPDMPSCASRRVAATRHTSPSQGAPPSLCCVCRRPAHPATPPTPLEAP